MKNLIYPTGFSQHEFPCKCGCNLDLTTQRLLDTLGVIRQRLGGKPINITSGTRCRTHNAKTPGASQRSDHLTGEAADIWVSGMNGETLGKAIYQMWEAGALPYLTYCYPHAGGNSVHVGVSAGKGRAYVFVDFKGFGPIRTKTS